MEIITSRKNQKIMELSTLFSDKKLRKKSGFFVLEGVKFCNEALKAGLVKELFITPRCLDKYPSFADIDHTVVSEHVYDKITLLKSPEGVCVKCLSNIKSISLLPDKRYVVLNDIQNPENAGAMIRTAAAFGFDGVISCGGVDLTSPKLQRAAAGATFVVTLYEGEIQEVFRHAQQSKLHTIATSPTAPTPLSDCNPQNGFVIFIGNEGNGLSDDTIDRCDSAVRIELVGMESLNAAVSAGVVMYQLGRR